ncbi:hypothetical protein DFP73DRAFT_585102 [Morchella snyderi]|nr:hypothetical protein DFP73DRAFT_585102 [Morchella snyderi]
MVFHSSVTSALLASIIFLLGANCQESIIKPDQLSLVTKGEDYSIMWRVIDPPEISHVSITLVNPSMDLGSLGTITNAFHMEIDDREEGSGFFLYRYSWFPSTQLEASDSYRIRIVDGNATMISQSFYIGSIADIRKGPVQNKGSGMSAAMVGSVVGSVAGGVLVGGTFTFILIAVYIHVARRRGWTLKNKGKPDAETQRMEDLGSHTLQEVYVETCEREELEAREVKELETREVKELETREIKVLSAPFFYFVPLNSARDYTTRFSWFESSSWIHVWTCSLESMAVNPTANAPPLPQLFHSMVLARALSQMQPAPSA